MFQVARANAVTEWPLRELLSNRPAVTPILSKTVVPTEIDAPSFNRCRWRSASIPLLIYRKVQGDDAFRFIKTLDLSKQLSLWRTTGALLRNLPRKPSRNPCLERSGFQGGRQPLKRHSKRDRPPLPRTAQFPTQRSQVSQFSGLDMQRGDKRRGDAVGPQC